jgi:nitrile hydratase beta subunit
VNGVHDMGGMDGFGPVVPEPEEPVFHEPWEGRVLGMSRSLTFNGAYNLSAARYSEERLPPAQYLGAGYYERIVLGMEQNLREKGLVGDDELAAGRALRPGAALPRRLSGEDISPLLVRGRSSRPPDAPPRFAVGDRVRGRQLNPHGHIRLPRYARGRAGVVQALCGFKVLPDTVAVGAGEHPQWWYTIVFRGEDLWGPGSDPTLTVAIGAAEGYLEPDQ